RSAALRCIVRVERCMRSAGSTLSLQAASAGPAGKAIRRADLVQAQSSTASSGPLPTYRLASEPPKHWLPLFVKNAGTPQAPKNVFSLHVEQASGHTPWGQLLAPYKDSEVTIREEEIPREHDPPAYLDEIRDGKAGGEVIELRARA